MPYPTKNPRGKAIRYRVKDVGRKGHHYLLIAVKKGEGKRGGRTEAKLVTYKKSRKKGESPFRNIAFDDKMKNERGKK